MSNYCEDYPCCGHTDGLGCNWKPPTEYPHAGCDHNTGYCEVWEAEQDDDSYDTFCDECSEFDGEHMGDCSQFPDIPV